MRPHFERTVGQSGQADCFDVDHVVLILEWAFNKQKLAARDHQSILVIEVGRDDDVRNARLVLHRNEDKLFRGAGPLASDDAAGHADKLSVSALPEILSRKDIAAAQLGAPVYERQ